LQKKTSPNIIFANVYEFPLLKYSNVSLNAILRLNYKFSQKVSLVFGTADEPFNLFV
jgi:hypothetical protein